MKKLKYKIADYLRDKLDIPIWVNEWEVKMNWMERNIETLMRQSDDRMDQIRDKPENVYSILEEQERAIKNIVVMIEAIHLEVKKK